MLRLYHTEGGPLLQIRGGCSVHTDAVQHARCQGSIHDVSEQLHRSTLIARTNGLNADTHCL